MDNAFVYKCWRENPNAWWTTTTYAWPIVQIKNVSLAKYEVEVQDPFGENATLKLDEMKARLHPRIKISVE